MQSHTDQLERRKYNKISIVNRYVHVAWKSGGDDGYILYICIRVYEYEYGYVHICICMYIYCNFRERVYKIVGFESLKYLFANVYTYTCTYKLTCIYTLLLSHYGLRIQI
jgi:hypothetical protein